MKINKNIRNFISFAYLLLSACTHTATDESAMEVKIGSEAGSLQAVEPPARYLEPYAEFIGEGTVKAFPHLKRYQGFGVIGNKSFQVILHEATGEGNTSELQLVRRVFILKAKRWYEQRQIEYLGLQFKSGVRQLPLSLRAMNPTTFSDQNAAQVELVVSLVGTRYQPKVFLNVIGDQPSFYLTFAVSSLVAGSKDQSEVSASINLKKKSGVVISEDFSTMYYSGEGVLSIISPSQLLYKNNLKSISVDQKLSPRRNWNGFKVSFGSFASSRYLVDPLALPNCLPTNPGDNAIVGLTNLERCLSKAEHGTLVVDLASEQDSSAAHSRRKFMIASQGSSSAKGFFSVEPGSSQSIDLPPDQDFYVKDLISNEKWGSKTSIRIAKDSIETIHLNPWKLVEGTIVFNSAVAPVFMSVQAADPDLKELNLTPDLTLLSSGNRLNEEMFLIKETPVKLRGHPGLYNVTFFYDGYASILCDLKLILSEQGDGEQECVPNKINRVFPNALDFFSSLDIGNNPRPKRFYDSELGVEGWVLASDLVHDDINQKTFSTGEVSSMDERLGAVRRVDPQAFIELGCPDDYVSIEKYLELVKKVKPDALRLYRCPRSEDAFTYIAKQWTEDDGPFPFITPVSDSSQGHPRYFSKVVFKESAIGFEEYFSELKSGDFDVSSGVEIEVSNVSIKRVGESKELSLKLLLSEHSGVRAHTVKVYGLNNFSYQKNIVLGNGSDHTVDLKFSIPLNAEFLRFEVWGKEGSSSGDASEILGATRIFTSKKGNEKK